MYLLCILEFVLIFEKFYRLSPIGIFFLCVEKQGGSCHVKVVDLAISSLFSQVYYSIFYSLPDIITRAECVVSYTSI